MRFVRLTREQFDILAPDHPHCVNTRPYAEVHGLLEFDGCEFPCTLKTFHQGQSLVLTPSDLEEKWCDELVGILERAFPHPNAVCSSVPGPSGKWIKAASLVPLAASLFC
jgi:hypothetical protein